MLAVVSWQDGSKSGISFDLDRLTRRQYYNMVGDYALINTDGLPPHVQEQATAQLTSRLVECCIAADARQRITALPWIRWKTLIDFFLPEFLAPTRSFLSA